MFKNDFKVSKHNLLAKKGFKKMSKALKAAFNEKVVNKICKNLNGLLFDDKISKTKSHIYRTEENPYFVDSTGKLDFFPTIQAVIFYPNLLKS